MRVSKMPLRIGSRQHFKFYCFKKRLDISWELFASNRELT